MGIQKIIDSPTRGTESTINSNAGKGFTKEHTELLLREAAESALGFQDRKADRKSRRTIDVLLRSLLFHVVQFDTYTYIGGLKRDVNKDEASEKIRFILKILKSDSTDNFLKSEYGTMMTLTKVIISIKNQSQKGRASYIPWRYFKTINAICKREGFEK